MAAPGGTKTLNPRPSISYQEQSNPESSDNTGGSGVTHNQTENDKRSPPGGGGGEVGQAKPQTVASGPVVNSASVVDQSKEASAIGGVAATRKVMPSSSSRNGATATAATGGVAGVAVRQLDEPCATDMSDTSDSEQDKNLECVNGFCFRK